MIPLSIFALIFASCALQWFTELPNPWLLGLFVLLSLLGIRRYLMLKLLVAALLGLWITSWCADHRLGKQLPNEIIQQTITVRGEVISIPRSDQQRMQWVAQLTERKTAKGWQPFEIRAKLNLYAPLIKQPEVKIGDKWEWTVRLKPPHGLSNPGGHAQEKALFLQNIQATGYVVLKVEQHQLASNPSLMQQFLAWRSELADQVTLAVDNSEYIGFLHALTLGIRDKITTEQWQLLQATGTSHLMAISGLHIGLVAGLVFKLSTWVWRLRWRANYRWSAPVFSAWMAILAAWSYSLLSGFSVPAQRACIMLSVAMWGIIRQQYYSAWHVLAVAAFFVWCLDPFATWSPGFWLSFIAVAIIYLGLRDRMIQRSLWQQFGRTQWLVFVGLTPITLGFFGQLSWISPFVNLIAVPWVGSLVVPLALFGVVLLPLFSNIAQFLLQLADWGLVAIFTLMKWSASLPGAVYQFSFIPLEYLCLAGVGFFSLLLPRGTPGRYCAAITLLPLLYMVPERPLEREVWVEVLDVGQGLAILVQTKNHVLIFDTGPQWFKDSDAAKNVILPLLSLYGIKKIDTLIITHMHLDHAGGWNSLKNAMSIGNTYSGFNAPHTMHCLAGEQWVWDEIKFQFLHPVDTNEGDINNHSCVLKVTTGEHSILLTGDIESKAEFQLLQRQTDLKSDVLVVPHHGSLTSSTLAFVNAVHPQDVIYPVGYFNRFEFPKEAVMARYDSIGAKTWRTDLHGAVKITLSPREAPKISSFREEENYFWRGQ